MTFSTLVEKILSKHTEADVRVPAVISIQTTSHLDAAFQLLSDRKIRSAPVFDPTTGKYIGFLDTADMIALVVRLFVDSPPADGAPSSHAYHDLHHALSHASKLYLMSASQITDLSKENPFVPLAPNVSLYEVAKVMATGIHRVPIVDEKGALVNVVTQSALVKFLVSHLNVHLHSASSTSSVASVETSTSDDNGKEQWEDLQLDESVGSLKLGVRKVICVSGEDRTVDAFATMLKNHISAIAVLDEAGKIMGNVSNSDIRVLCDPSAMPLITGPVAQFISHIRQADLSTRYPSISVRLGTTLRQTLAKLVATGIHRIYVIDDHSRPIGVISLTDVFRFAVHPQ
eukprot:ANDGO_05792.mRNA.1 Protein sds23